jgi:hypothetical protein
MSTQKHTGNDVCREHIKVPSVFAALVASVEEMKKEGFYLMGYNAV